MKHRGADQKGAWERETAGTISLGGGGGGGGVVDPAGCHWPN